MVASPVKAPKVEAASRATPKRAKSPQPGSEQPAGLSQTQIRALQRTIGNQAVLQLLARRAESKSVQPKILGENRTPSSIVASLDTAESYFPEVASTETGPKTVEAWGPVEAPVTGQPVPGETGRDPLSGALPGTARTGPDKPPALPIIAGLSYETVKPVRGQVKDHPLTTELFGLTVSTGEREYMRVDHAPSLDAYLVSGDVIHRIYWDMWDQLGPQDQVDITAVDDPDLTAANYRDVAQDLKPGDGNIPPRKRYFASDLTKRHEMFHWWRHIRYYREGLGIAINWLNRHTARSAAEVDRLIDRMLENLDAYVDYRTDPMRSSEEHDAYEAGARYYQQRSDEIHERGRNGGYT